MRGGLRRHGDAISEMALHQSRLDEGQRPRTVPQIDLDCSGLLATNGTNDC